MKIFNRIVGGFYTFISYFVPGALALFGVSLFTRGSYIEDLMFGKLPFSISIPIYLLIPVTMIFGSLLSSLSSIIYTALMEQFETKKKLAERIQANKRYSEYKSSVVEHYSEEKSNTSYLIKEAMFIDSNETGNYILKKSMGLHRLFKSLTLFFSLFIIILCFVANKASGAGALWVIGFVLSIGSVAIFSKKAVKLHEIILQDCYYIIYKHINKSDA